MLYALHSINFYFYFKVILLRVYLYHNVDIFDIAYVYILFCRVLFQASCKILRLLSHHSMIILATLLAMLTPMFVFHILGLALVDKGYYIHREQGVIFVDTTPCYELAYSIRSAVDKIILGIKVIEKLSNSIESLIGTTHPLIRAPFTNRNLLYVDLAHKQTEKLGM